MKLGKAYLDLWGSSMRRLAGEPSKPTVEPSPRDKRFSDPEWRTNHFFDFVMQAYLLTTEWANDLVKNAEGLDAHTRFWNSQPGNLPWGLMNRRSLSAIIGLHLDLAVMLYCVTEQFG